MDISNNDVSSTPGATASRRKSGRAVKVPEKFVPDAPSTQQAPASAKRKRGEEDDENDASEIDEDEEEIEEDEESAAEEEVRAAKRKQPKKTKKPATKKPKVNGTAAHEEAPTVRLPARPKKAKRVAIADKDVEGLYGRCASTEILETKLIFNSGCVHERTIFERCCGAMGRQIARRRPCCNGRACQFHTTKRGMHDRGHTG